MRIGILSASVLLALLLLTISSQAQASSSVSKSLPDTLETNVYYGNGIRTLEEEAKTDLAEIKIEYEDHLNALRDSSEDFRDETYSFDTAYNPTFGGVEDIAEVLLQKARELELLKNLGEVTQSTLSGLDLLEIAMFDGADRESFVRAKLADTPSGDVSEVDFEEIVNPRFWNPIRQAYQDFMRERLADLNTTDSDLTSKYVSDMKAGRRVIVLAHSQGNLFASDNVESARTADDDFVDAIGLYGVATPAGRLIEGGDYVTAHDDRVIDFARLQAIILPSNLDNNPEAYFREDNRSWHNHEFAGDYFAESLRSRFFIDEGIENLARTLKYPRIESGSITVRVVDYPEIIIEDPPNAGLYAFQNGGDGFSPPQVGGGFTIPGGGSTGGDGPIIDPDDIPDNPEPENIPGFSKVVDGEAEVVIDCVDPDGDNVIVIFQPQLADSGETYLGPVQISSTIFGDSMSGSYTIPERAIDSETLLDNILFEIEFSTTDEGEVDYAVVSPRSE